MENYYAVLGVAPSASLSEIKRAYRKKAKEMHPDTGRGKDSRNFASLARAYAVLSDAKRRSFFDSAFAPAGSQHWGKGADDSFDYRKWLLERDDEESRCKLVLFDLLHSREDDAVSEYVQFSAGKNGFLFLHWFPRNDAMDFGFILAEELALRKQYYEAALLLVNIIAMEKRSPYFRLFMPDVISFAKFVLLQQLEGGVPDELALDAWERALEVGVDKTTDTRLLQKMAKVYAKMGDTHTANNFYEAARA